MNSVQLLAAAQFHGARRLASSKYKFYWALTLVALLCCSLSALFVAVNRYFQNPTYAAHYEVTQTMKPFPTVVLCPEVEFPEYKISAFLQDLKYPAGINASYIAKVLPQFGAFISPDVQFDIEDLEKIQYLLDYNDVNIETAGKRLTSDCSETIIRCRWLNKNINCNAAFRFELTSYGFCCIFNGFSLKREIINHGVHSNITKKRLYVDSIGFTNSLMIAVNQSIRPLGSLDLSYKWLVLQTALYADIVYNGTAVSPAMETWAGYGTTVLHVTDDAERLGNELRHCRMVHERLKYFPIYHKRYCLLECDMERVKRQCNCVQVVHPHVREEKTTPICTAKHITCVRKVAGVSFSHQYTHCRCPPSCDSEIENTVISSFELLRDSKEFDDFYSDLDFDQVSIIRVYILRHNRRAISRQSYFPTHQLFSQLGGVFGVFFGCSILSLMEILQLACYATRDLFNQTRAMKKELESTKKVISTMKVKK